MLTGKFKAAVLGLTMLAAAPTAFASTISYNFNYTQGANTYFFGTMQVSFNSPNAIAVRFDAAPSVPAISGFQVTGFGFDFSPEQPSLNVLNPSAGTFAFDQDGLNWLKLDNLNAIPNPPVGPDKSVFEFGVTEGNSNNINPPGIAAGQSDVFYLSGFVPGITAETNLASLIEWAGIRIQSLPDGINGGSLFLVGTVPGEDPKVPEPATLALLGAGLLGLGFARRRGR